MTHLLECGGLFTLSLEGPPLLRLPRFLPIAATSLPRLQSAGSLLTCHPELSEGSAFPSSPSPTQTCHPACPERTRRDRSAGAVCRRSVEASRPDPCGLPPSAIFEFRLSSFAFRASPPQCTTRHTPHVGRHSLPSRCTIYRDTTFLPVRPQRCYSYLFRWAQHGITQCRGGHE